MFALLSANTSIVTLFRLNFIFHPVIITIAPDFSAIFVFDCFC